MYEHPQDILHKDRRILSRMAHIERRLQTLESGVPLPRVENVPATDVGAEGRITVRSGGSVTPSLLVKVDGMWHELVFTTPR